MNQEELEKKIIEMEEKLDTVIEHSNELEEQTRQAFSKILKMMTRYADINNEIVERDTIELEERVRAMNEDDSDTQDLHFIEEK